MNIGEGVRRIAQVFRWGGDGLAVLFALGALAILFKPDVTDRAGLVGIFAGMAILFSGAGRVLAWILLGFAKDK